MRLKLAEIESCVRGLCEAGQTRQEIANHFCVDIKTIHNWYKKLGLQSLYTRRGRKNYNWNGGRKVNDDGYVLVMVSADDPLIWMARDDKYVLEHRIVMARRLGRPLRAYETVHHVNGRRDDNRIDNLQLMFGPHARGSSLVCACCGSSDIIPREIQETSDGHLAVPASVE